MKRLLTACIILLTQFTIAQTVTINPAIPRADEPITITVNVGGTRLNGYAWNNTTAPVWLWTWITDGCASQCDAPTNVNPATSPAQDAAKATRIGTNPDIYQITFTPTVFFNKPVSDIKQIGVKLKTRDWADNKQSDIDKFITFSQEFAVKFIQPTQSSFLINQNQDINISVVTNESASINLKVNDVSVATSAGQVTSLNYVHTVTQGSGSIRVTAEANNGTETKTTSFNYVIRSSTTNEVRPEGIVDGINYDPDPTKVTLGLWAPQKSSVYVLGDFNDWKIDPQYLMKKDGEHFWIEIDNLVAGEEYAYQYLVNETLYIADPYADKILDPDDQFIPSTTYPDLKVYPAEAKRDQSYFNRVAVFQTQQTPYVWQSEGYQKPAKENLVIYELLIRDFFKNGDRNYQNLIDTLGYFKKLGINAIELMPITEFNGNESWGYNPTFMLAPDKYYGTKNNLKEFIDKCHQQGIAVIMDIVMNQQDLPNPYVLMYYDFANNKPLATNPWFNRDATHPFNVFFDLNHESAYTKKYLDTVTHYWMNEFKVDGYRFDLSKGFTQKNANGNVATWGQYDASRIAILKRMSDKIWEHTPDAYVILEHFADNSEEKELAEYRSNEGKGMMLWGNYNYAYNQNTMGASGADFSTIYFANRNWSVPHVVGYMESHDEERLMYNNLTGGKVSGSYSAKNLNTALERMKAASLVFYTIPGPKMLWQFGELGYDKSINTCEDGTINNGCRISPKPIHWDYKEEEKRYSLYTHIGDLLELRNKYSVFNTGSATVEAGTSFVKQITLKNTPYTTTPADETEMNVQVIANFDVADKNSQVNFPHTGTWYEYYSGSEVAVGSLPHNLTLPPGAYKLYTDVKISTAPVTSIVENIDAKIVVYPNPVTSQISIKEQIRNVENILLYSAQGAEVHPRRISLDTWDVSHLQAGLYIVKIIAGNSVYRTKIIKR